MMMFSRSTICFLAQLQVVLLICRQDSKAANSVCALSSQWPSKWLWPFPGKEKILI
jgi:hypothetical protein